MYIILYIYHHNAHTCIYTSEIKLELSGIEPHFSRFTAYQPAPWWIIFFAQPIPEMFDGAPFFHSNMLIKTSNELIWLVDWNMNFSVPYIRNIWEFHGIS